MNENNLFNTNQTVTNNIINNSTDTVVVEPTTTLTASSSTQTTLAGNWGQIRQSLSGAARERLEAFQNLMVTNTASSSSVETVEDSIQEAPVVINKVKGKEKGKEKVLEDEEEKESSFEGDFIDEEVIDNDPINNDLIDEIS